MNTSRPHRQRAKADDDDRSTGLSLSREPVTESEDTDSSTAPARARQAALTQELIDLAQTAREELRTLRADTSADYNPEVLRLALLAALHTPEQAHAIATEFALNHTPGE